MNDVSRWMAATKVNQERQGPLLASAIGGAGRTVADEIDDTLLAHGDNMDLGDGEGLKYRTGPRLLFIALESKFPDNLEANMLRAGLDFFAFCPRRDETVQLIFLRFDSMLDRANELADLDISFPFRTWMLLSRLRLPPNTWSDNSKSMGPLCPQNGHE